MDSCCVIICSCWQFPCHWDWLLQLPLSVSTKIAFFSAVFFFIVVLSDCPALYILLWETRVNWDREGRSVQQAQLQEESKQWLFGSDFHSALRCLASVSGAVARRRNTPLTQLHSASSWREREVIKTEHIESELRHCDQVALLGVVSLSWVFSSNAVINLWSRFLIIFSDPAEQAAKSPLLLPEGMTAWCYFSLHLLCVFWESSLIHFQCF